MSAMVDCGHTLEWTGPTVERVLSNGKRVFALSFRRWLVGQAHKPGASVAGLALQHGINANQLRRWMVVDEHVRTGGQPVALLPVMIESNSAAPVAAPAPRPADGAIDIELAGARVRVRGHVEEDSLRCVLRALRSLA